MKRWKTYQISLFTIACMLLNGAGRLLASSLGLPMWLDSFGTVLCAYVGGPACGAIVGIVSSLMYGMVNSYSYVYSITGMALGIIVGVAARKEHLSTLFGTMGISAQAALTALVVSVPLNILVNGGSTGNKWGDGIIGLFRELGVPQVFCWIAGQFYIEFVDKLVTLLLLYIAYRIAGLFRKRKKTDAGEVPAAEKVLPVILALALCLGAFGASGAPARAEGAEANLVDYNDYVQTIYSSNNGLPCGEANDIVQTNDGILWIGTYAGLYRYNGSEFRWMDSYESVRNVNCLYMDEEGRLWIGTNDNGLSICINEQISSVVDQSYGLPSNSVRSIIQSSDGYYYIGTSGSMQVLTLSNGLRRVSTLWEVNYADKIAADEKGRVATITSDGRMFLLEKGRILSSIQLPLGGELFNTCCFDEEGTLLAGTSGNHLYVYDVSDGWFRELAVRTCEGLKSINDLYYAANGDLFVTADNGVGFIRRDREFDRINTNDFNNSIDNMLVDYQGNLWFTSSRLGLLRMAPSAFKDVYSTVGMDSRVVNTVAEWQGNYYFGTDKGLDVVDRTCRNRVTNALTEKLDGVRIRCIRADSAGSLWICTYGSGLLEIEADGTEHLYNRDNGSFGNRARVVGELSDGTILAAGDTGISFIRDHQIQHTIGFADGLINSMILTFTELPDGRILAGTDGDGIAVLEDGQVVRMLNRNDGLSSGVILRTVPDPKSGGVFIVTSNSLSYMNEGGDIMTLDNFPYFNNYDIWARDEDTLFVMSSAGIYVVDRDELLSGKDGINYDLLDSRRGLNSALTANSWNCSDDQGNLFLPCDKGVFIINAARYSSSTNAYRMMVSSVRLDNKTYRVDRSLPIEVSRGVSKIELFPEIINYTIHDPYVGYYLEGFDRDWTIMPRSALSTVMYTNLPTGSYVFHLAVFDNNQETILGQRDYNLIKEKEIYDDPGFIIYALVVPMVFVAWITWFTVRRRVQRMMERQRRELEMARRQIEMGNQTIIAIAKAVDAKDERTHQHSTRVAVYSVMIGKEMGFSDKECENLRRAAQMHDIGKIGIPDSILNKPSRLTDEEYAIMKSHVTRGAEILKDFTLIENVVDGARYHHERYDGRGYPEGLKGEEIPLYGRIIGVADAFDAMTANRVYRKQMDFGYVLNEMRNGRGTQFDPQIVDILLKLIEDGKIDLKAMYAVKDEDETPAPGKDAASGKDPAPGKADEPKTQA